MILLDTNVLSQPIRPDGSARVVAWIDKHFEDLFVPTVVVSELLFGAHKLEDERRRGILVLAIDGLIERFARRFATFDLMAARTHGRVTGDAARNGRTLSPSDSVIAATALARDWAVATRNIQHFEPAGVRVVNPWEA